MMPYILRFKCIIYSIVSIFCLQWKKHHPLCRKDRVPSWNRESLAKSICSIWYLRFSHRRKLVTTYKTTQHHNPEDQNPQYLKYVSKGWMIILILLSRQREKCFTKTQHNVCRSIFLVLIYQIIGYSCIFRTIIWLVFSVLQLKGSLVTCYFYFYSSVQCNVFKMQLITCCNRIFIYTFQRCKSRRRVYQHLHCTFSARTAPNFPFVTNIPWSCQTT
jgi:hypothetical protein